MSGGLWTLLALWAACVVGLFALILHDLRRHAPAPRRRVECPGAYPLHSSPHPKGHDVLWVPVDDQDEALSVIAGGTV